MSSQDDNGPDERPIDEKMVMAAEYALGTLDGDDRANVQMLMTIDPAFAHAVGEWERRLGELQALVQPVEPPPHTWEWIRARIATLPPSGRVWLPSVDDVSAAPPPSAAWPGAPSAEAAPPPPSAEVLLWRARTRQWQLFTTGIGAIAATVVALLGMRELRPEWLPTQWRPAPYYVEKQVEVVRTVEVPSPRMAEFVAVLQRDAASPAFVMTIDLSRRTMSVRRVGAEQEPGKDYELWLVSDRFPAPRSLGVVGDREFSIRNVVNEYDAPLLSAATYAVSVEPPGGSPTGAPTGPVVFTGKLVQTTPAAFPSSTP